MHAAAPAAAVNAVLCMRNVTENEQKPALIYEKTVGLHSSYSPAVLLFVSDNTRL